MYICFYVRLGILTPFNVNFTCKWVVPDNHNQVLSIEFIMLIKWLFFKYFTPTKIVF